MMCVKQKTQHPLPLSFFFAKLLSTHEAMRRTPLNIKSLRALIQLAESKDGIGIHEQMGMSRSTLWAYIDELEKEVGFMLVSRKKPHATLPLTENGGRFVPYARNIIASFEEEAAAAAAPENRKKSQKH